MAKIVKRFMMLTLIICMIMPIGVIAATNAEAIAAFVRDHGPITDANGKEVRAADSAWNSVSSYFTTQDTGGLVAVTAMKDGSTAIYYYNPANESAIVNGAGINSSLTETNDKIDEMTGNLNIQADTAGGAELVSGLVPIVNVMVGVIILAIVLGLMLYTGFDVMYLAFPVFRSFSEDKLQDGKTGVMVKKTSNGEAKYRFISDEAVRAYQQSIVDGGNKQPYIKYVVSRSWAYIALAIIVSVLLTGNYSVFLKIGLRIGEGIVNIVQDVGQV